MSSQRYEVWISLGPIRRPGPTFDRLRDALAYIEAHYGRFEVRLPNGKWLPIDQDQQMLATPA